MDYLVLARRLRPARFSDLVGQDTVVRILRNAIRTDRVAHAFLFAGSRGVGKTSAARILAKVWNCLDPQDAEPCNACDNCLEIAQNASPDVYEIDAASNRGIDNIRELRENLKFAPAKCRYKTYIVDEVHMLTIESFNALLKTLEEPPAHVKFILATTNPHKIPETILSRCQRFDFSRIPLGTMTDYLVQVTEREGIAISRWALEAIARNAAGGMRDALTALDQVVAFCGNEVDDEQVHPILGMMDNRAVLGLLEAVLERKLEAALAAFSAIADHGHDLQVLLEALLREVKDLTLFAALGGDDPYFQDHPPDTLSFFKERAEGLNLDEAQQLFYLFLELEGQLKRSQFAAACFEMALVKACQVQSLVGVPDLLSQARRLLGEPPRHGSGAPPSGGGGSAPGGDRADGGRADGAPPVSPAAHPARAQGADARQLGSHAPPASPSEPGATAPASGEPPPETTAGPPPVQAQPEPPPPPETAAGPPPIQAQPEPPPPPEPEPPPERENPPTEPPQAIAAADDGGTPPERENPPTEPPQAIAAADDGGTPPEAAPEAPPVMNAVTPEPTPEPPPVTDAVMDAVTNAVTNHGGAPPGADAGTPALSEDPRWQAFVERVMGTEKKKLAADLHQSEVTAIGKSRIEIVPPNEPAREKLIEELDWLAAPLAEAFGADFRIAVDRDKNKVAAAGRSLHDRREAHERTRLEGLRAEAVADDSVRRIRRFFPDGKVEAVHLPGSPNHERRDVR